MKYATGFLKVACALAVVLMQGVDASGHAHKKHAAGKPCRLKELATLTKSQVDESLRDFDKANGDHLGNWPPGFPELRVRENSSVVSSSIQCSLHFMAKGLEKVLEDQENHLNPKNKVLHKVLWDTISRVEMLAACVKSVLGDKCSPDPPPPVMPSYVFDRKQWSHTLLKAARSYLDWLQSVVSDPKAKETHRIKRKSAKAAHQRFLEGSGYPL